jgi:hypothetical protein
MGFTRRRGGMLVVGLIGAARWGEGAEGKKAETTNYTNSTNHRKSGRKRERNSHAESWEETG